VGNTGSDNGVPALGEETSTGGESRTKPKRKNQQERLTSSQVWWFIPIIPATRKAKIRRIMV
jgi:hypothetical protein